MTNKKYILLDGDYAFDYKGRHLRRIKYLRDVGDRVKKGDLGGWLEDERNLEHGGDCVVLGNAWVYDHAVVRQNAQVWADAVVRQDAVVDEDARVFGHADVRGDCHVHGKAQVSGYAVIDSTADLSGEVFFTGDAWASEGYYKGYGYYDRDNKLHDD